METRTAIVFGATGLVGSSLIGELCNSEIYGLIRVFVRNKTVFSENEKIKEYIINFSHLKDYAELIKGDDLFICLGTTIKKAGSVRRMEEIDCELPLEIAALASVNSVEKVAVVSSLGADSRSSNYYLRIKGEMEKGLMKLNFRTIIILRPSILLGERAEKRTGEEIGKAFMKFSAMFLVGRLAKYRGIDGGKVARAMVRAINEKSGTEILESDTIQKIGGIN
jgi:uncharacterized protein YbjT (DUF2867 family)